MRTERILAAHAAHPFDLSITESTEYLGRAVRAREYNFTEIDGRQPAAFRMPKADA
ncbi:MAG TPA: hypothetical protein VH107_20225 [Lacipirellulaceae bacterium]|jgi:hypothetical protein|nr:hypothetical protein [Lacipirellulaceae bacterium]